MRRVVVSCSTTLYSLPPHLFHPHLIHPNYHDGHRQTVHDRQGFLCDEGAFTMYIYASYPDNPLSSLTPRSHSPSRWETAPRAPTTRWPRQCSLRYESSLSRWQTTHAWSSVQSEKSYGQQATDSMSGNSNENQVRLVNTLGVATLTSI